MKKIGIIVTLLILIILSSTCIYRQKQREIFLNEESTIYLKGVENEVIVLDKDKKEISLPRGKELRGRLNKEVNIEEEIYYEILDENDNLYYVLKDNITSNRNDSVILRNLFAIRDQVIYESKDSHKIKGSIFEGDELEVLGYENLKYDGSVDYYLVKHNDIEGYIKNDKKYIDKEFIDISYDASKYLELSGEEASRINYYPKEVYDFPDNHMPESVKSLYINAGTIAFVDEYIRIANESNINAFVIDIKDTDVISYESNVIKEYSPSSANGINSLEYFKNQVAKLNDAGFYTIGRITVFKDPGFALDHEDLIVELNDGPYVFNGSKWPSIFQRKVWEYNVSLALEAIRECHFDEIQFDYVRLPEYIPEEADMKNDYNETSVEAITHFINYACDVLHKENVYVSIDVFGEVAGMFVTSYGQYWPAISNAADAISPMPYPDHFGRGAYGIKEPWKDPYALMHAWGSEAMKCQENTYDPGKLRTWIQVYNSVVDRTVYDTEKVKDQIRALNDVGIYDGYITWNGAASFEKFDLVKDAFE